MTETVIETSSLTRRYEPAEDPQAAPFNVPLNAGESVTTTKRFTLPADARDPGLVVAHGRFPGMFIIADGQSLFHKPSVVRLQSARGGPLLENGCDAIDIQQRHPADSASSRGS